MEDSALMRGLPFWENLTEAERALVQAGSFTRRYAAGSCLDSREDSCLGMLHLLRGRLRVCLLSEEGREITLFRLNEGDNCVLSASCVVNQLTFESQIIAENDTELLVLPSGLFGQLTERNIHVRCFLYELATQRFSSVVWVMQQILFARFDRRLATFLLEQDRENGGLPLHMTQEQIARDVNSAREVVARMLKQFASDGLVEVRRGSICLLDREGLAALRG